MLFVKTGKLNLMNLKRRKYKMNQEISSFEMSILKIICEHFPIEFSLVKEIYKKVNSSFDKTIEVIVLSRVFHLDTFDAVETAKSIN